MKLSSLAPLGVAAQLTLWATGALATEKPVGENFDPSAEYHKLVLPEPWKFAASGDSEQLFSVDQSATPKLHSSQVTPSETADSLARTYADSNSIVGDLIGDSLQAQFLSVYTRSWKSNGGVSIPDEVAEGIRGIIKDLNSNVYLVAVLGLPDAPSLENDAFSTMANVLLNRVAYIDSTRILVTNRVIVLPADYPEQKLWLFGATFSKTTNNQNTSVDSARGSVTAAPSSEPIETAGGINFATAGFGVSYNSLAGSNFVGFDVIDLGVRIGRVTPFVIFSSNFLGDNEHIAGNFGTRVQLSNRFYGILDYVVGYERSSKSGKEATIDLKGFGLGCGIKLLQLDKTAGTVLNLEVAGGSSKAENGPSKFGGSIRLSARMDPKGL